MKCHRHVETDAQAICTNCGRALCQPCITTADGEPAACSETCAAQTRQLRRALDSIAAKVRRSSTVNANFLWLSGSIFVVVGLLGIMAKNAFLSVFPTVLGLVFIVAGYWYRRVGTQDS